MHVLDLQQETIFITGETLETDLPKPGEGLESDKNLKGNPPSSNSTFFFVSYLAYQAH